MTLIVLGEAGKSSLNPFNTTNRRKSDLARGFAMK